ncbi:MAG: DMT family transporter [Oscillibacter sp.]|nr:DMT family transporter [Oscillibacter sp.]
MAGKRLILFLGVVCGSSAALLVRASTAPSIVLVVYRMALTVLLLTPALLRGKDDLRNLDRRTLALCALSGVALGLHFALYFSAVRRTSLAACGILVDMEVLFVAFASVLILHKKLSAKAWAAILIALTGAILIGLGDVGSGAGDLTGDAMAFLAAACMGAYTMLGSVCRRRITTVTYTYIVYAMAALTTLVLSLAGGTPLFGYGSVNLLTALGLAVFCTLLSHSVFSWALRYLSAPFVSTALLLDGVCAALWGVILYGERPGALVIVGAVLTIAGIAFYTRIREEETV